MAMLNNQMVHVLFWKTAAADWNKILWGKPMARRGDSIEIPPLFSLVSAEIPMEKSNESSLNL